MTKLARLACAGTVAAAMLFGMTGPLAVEMGSAQEATQTPTTTTTQTDTTPARVETEEGFDNWGLLGLLGLLGLAGLRRQPERVVATVDRTTRPIVDRP